MSHTPLKYDLVVLGATGYTASIIAEYITKELPTDLKWAVAGRSAKKLEELVEKLAELNGDRSPPGIEIVDLEKEQLHNVASRTRLIINGIETPWVEEMIRKYDKIAQKTGAIIIPTCALTPSDLVAFLVAKAISEQPSSIGTAEVNSTAKLELQGMSAGSTNTVISLMSTYGMSWIWPGKPWAHTLQPQPKNIHVHTPFMSRLFGYRSIPGLGMVTTSFLAIANESIIHRSAYIMPGIYGPEFNFREFLPVPTFFAATFVHFLTRLGLILLAIPPVRRLLKMLLPPGGTGPDVASANVEKQVCRAIGSPASSTSKKVEAVFSYEGSLYYCGAVMGVEAARKVLGSERTIAHELGGSVLTPATLGMPFVERIRSIGARLEVVAA